MHEDSFRLSPGKNGARAFVTEGQAKGSLQRGRKAISKIYGFDLADDDSRVSVVGTRREGNTAFVTYGARGRKLDASALAYELNN